MVNQYSNYYWRKAGLNVSITVARGASCGSFFFLIWTLACFRPLILKAWFPGQQHHSPLGTYQERKFFFFFLQFTHFWGGRLCQDILLCFQESSCEVQAYSCPRDFRYKLKDAQIYLSSFDSHRVSRDRFYLQFLNRASSFFFLMLKCRTSSLIKTLSSSYNDQIKLCRFSPFIA